MRSAKGFSSAIAVESGGVIELAFVPEKRLGSTVMYAGDEGNEGKFFDEGNGDEIAGDLAVLVEGDGRVGVLRLQRALTGR